MNAQVNRSLNGRDRVLALSLAALAGCGAPTRQTPDAGTNHVVITLAGGGVQDVDLLVMIDNSASMADNQTAFMAQLERMIVTLTVPECVSMSNPTRHACDAANPTDVRARGLHVGVVSSDPGTPGSVVAGCQITDPGDAGMLDPICYGMAMARHEPFSAPASFGRPASCVGVDQSPSFVDDVKCNAGLYVGGCGLASQLEAVSAPSCGRTRASVLGTPARTLASFATGCC